jgi:DnaK suppressor protein
MNMERYREKLIKKEQELLKDLKRTISLGSQPSEPGGLDSADESVYSQQKELLFAQADIDTQLLTEVRGALARIEKGSYGKCLADGEMIAKARLDVVPWATYCIEHQSYLDERAESRAA